MRTAAAERVHKRTRSDCGSALTAFARMAPRCYVVWSLGRCSWALVRTWSLVVLGSWSLVMLVRAHDHSASLCPRPKDQGPRTKADQGPRTDKAPRPKDEGPN